MLELCAVLLFALHLVLVNLASTGPPIAAWLDLREGRGDATAGWVGRRLLDWSVVALLLGVVAGVALGALCWDDGYRLAAFRLRSKIYFGIAEIAFSLVLLVVQSWCWRRGWGSSSRGRWGRLVLAWLAATNLLYHFPLLLVIFARIASGLDEGIEPLSSADFRERIVDATVMARSLHFWLASVAVGGAALMAAATCGAAQERAATSEAEALDLRRLGIWGARLALVPTLLQVVSGVWLLVQLEPSLQARILGGNALASLSFAGGVGLALWLMHRFAGAALGDVSRSSVLVTLGALLGTIVLMTATLRHLERSLRTQTQARVEAPRGLQKAVNRVGIVGGAWGSASSRAKLAAGGGLVPLLPLTPGPSFQPRVALLPVSEVWTCRATRSWGEGGCAWRLELAWIGLI